MVSKSGSPDALAGLSTPNPLPPTEVSYARNPSFSNSRIKACNFPSSKPVYENAKGINDYHSAGLQAGLQAEACADS